MMEVRLVLYDVIELEGYKAFYTALLERRAELFQAAQAARVGAPAGSEPVPSPAEAGSESAPTPAAAVPQADGDSGAAGETHADVTPKDLFKQYLDTHGFAAARKKLDAFGLQRISDLTSEQTPDFLKSLTESQAG